MFITKKPLTILIIGDYAEENLILKEHLKEINVPVEKILHSVNMECISSLIENINIDLVFLDLSLPDSSGVNSLEKVKYHLPKTAIICLSGFSGDDIALKAISPGAQDYLAKEDFDHKLLTKSIQYSIERKQLENELAVQYLNQQKLITETTLIAQEKERNEIGKELHDNINQLLTTVKLYHSMMKASENKDGNLLSKSTEYLDAAIEEIRKLSKSLVSPSLGNISLKKALNDLVEEVNKTQALKINFNYDLDEKENLGSRKELMIYRVVQEQLNNILKHSQAKNAKIKLSKREKNLLLTISDNGIGFDIHDRPNGIGVQNIKSRIEFYSGEFTIISEPGEGCKFKIIIPC